MESYLALPDGAGRFTQDFTGPALLRIPLRAVGLRLQGSHLLWLAVPGHSTRLPAPMLRSYNPAGAVTPPVWAAPRSLATT